MDWRTLGASVVVSASGRPDVRGWLWRETPDGIYVALDKEAKEIRFVRSGGLNIGYQYEDMDPGPSRIDRHLSKGSTTSTVS